MDIKFCETPKTPGIAAAPWECAGIYGAGRICRTVGIKLVYARLDGRIVKPSEPDWCVRDWMGVCEAVGTKPVYVRLDERMWDWNRRT